MRLDAEFEVESNNKKNIFTQNGKIFNNLKKRFLKFKIFF